jgi:hypothetical protein
VSRFEWKVGFKRGARRYDTAKVIGDQDCTMEMDKDTVDEPSDFWT